MINLEQSAVNVYAQSNLMSSDATKQVKDDGLKLVKIEIDEESAGGDKQMASFIAYLERPYFDKGKKSGDISMGMHVNMHTVRSISFTRGFVLKKHLVPRKEIET